MSDQSLNTYCLPHIPIKQNWAGFSEFIKNDFNLMHGLNDLVHALLELENSLVGSSLTEKQNAIDLITIK